MLAIDRGDAGGRSGERRVCSVLESTDSPTTRCCHTTQLSHACHSRVAYHHNAASVYWDPVGQLLESLQLFQQAALVSPSNLTYQKQASLPIGKRATAYAAVNQPTDCNTGRAHIVLAREV